jgi:hypothetical protein
LQLLQLSLLLLLLVWLCGAVCGLCCFCCGCFALHAVIKLLQAETHNACVYDVEQLLCGTPSMQGHNYKALHAAAAAASTLDAACRHMSCHFVSQQLLHGYDERVDRQ